MAVAGEPLQSRHVVWLYSKQAAKGTPVTPATAIGISPLRVRSASGLRAIKGMGSAHPLFLKPGGASAPFSPSNVLVQNTDFLTDCCVRNAQGVLEWFTLAAGYRDDAESPVQWAWQIQDCKVHQFGMRLEGSEDGSGLLGLDFSGVGGLITDVSTLAPANASEEPFAEWEAVLTRGGASHEARSFSATCDHNVKVKWVIHGSAPAVFKRGWTYQVEGDQDVSGEVSRFAKSGINLQADTIAGSDLVLALTDIGGSGNALTLTTSGSKYSEEEQSSDPGGDLVFTLPFLATGISIA